MKIKNIAWVCLVLPALIGSCYTVFRIVGVPENHVGIDPWLLAAGALPAIAAAFLEGGVWRVLAFTIAITNLAIVAGAVHFNLLLQYEDWIRIGMPDKPNWFEVR